jgi:endonuclease/exonuclease/phosphatase family metal-dependent hydrolase
MKIISWNMARRHRPWRCLLDMEIDLALLQEAVKPPPDVAERIQADPAIEVDPAPWRTVIAGGSPPYKTAIVKLSNRIEVEWIEAKSVDVAQSRDLAASWPGTLAAASVTPPTGAPLIAVSVYAQWLRTHVRASNNLIVSDASAHHVVSDLSMLIAKEDGHRVLAAGDMNILRGYGEYGSGYWANRYKTVFDRMAALGLPCVGPEYPYGRQADPWPDELPRDSRNVPTFHSNRQSPGSATRQLDYVFASTELAASLGVRALNAPEEWGSSDHCRLEIDLAEGA